MKTTLIITALNEEKEILNFLYSLKNQTKFPDELIIVDGGSTDNTIENIADFNKKNIFKFKVKILRKKGNISIGRNYAIQNASNEIILCTDGDCILDKNWIKNISAPFKDKSVDVASGFYNPTGDSVFEKCLATYTSVMSDKLDEKNFIPSSRSIAYRKSAWKKIKGYPNWLDRGEDLYFAKKLKEMDFKFKFVKDAIVFWPQRKNLSQAFKQFYGYAKGDGLANNIRNEVLLVYLRYFVGSYLIFISILERSKPGLILAGVLLLFYIFWSIKKNYHYVKNKKAVVILPMLQLTADFAILTGTISGLFKRITIIKLKKNILESKFLILILLIYSLILLLTIKYGAPSSINPYPYNMDEWHQLQAVRTTVAYGTPNMFGSANGTMLHFILSAIYLVPFTLIGYINPVDLPVNDLIMRERIFDLLRINSLIYGSLSIIVLYLITKKLKISSLIVITLFVFSPIWISLSGYFKYDIALMFWILLSLFAFITFIKKTTFKNFILCSILAGLAFSVKVSALPLLPILFICFLLFYDKPLKNIKLLISGFFIYLFTVLMFGIPDTVFGNGNIILFLRENLIGFPSSVSNFNLGMNPLLYLYFKIYPIIFGHGLYVLFLISFISIIVFLINSGLKKSLEKYKIDIFIILSAFIFFISLIPLNLYAGGNKSLVLLPFAVIIIGLSWEKVKNLKKLNTIFAILISIVLVLNIVETFLWINLKKYDSPQVVSSNWIINNIPSNSIIGLENVPIYQAIPDILKKEFYFKQDGYGMDNLYEYSIVDAKSKNLPKIIVISNGQIEEELSIKSAKKDLMARLKNDGYEIVYLNNAKKPYAMSNRELNLAWLTPVPNTIAIYVRR